MRFKLNNTYWNIKEMAHRDLLNRFPGFDSILGVCNCEEHIIYLKKEHENISIRTTLIHELTHALLESLGMRGSEVILNEEQICEFMAYNIDTLKSIADRYIESRK